MKEFIVYSKDNCPYCEKAIRLLQDKSLSYIVLKYKQDFDIELMDMYQWSTFPKILSYDENDRKFEVGGYDNLVQYLNK